MSPEIILPNSLLLHTIVFENRFLFSRIFRKANVGLTRCVGLYRIPHSKNSCLRTKGFKIGIAIKVGTLQNSSFRKLPFWYRSFQKVNYSCHWAYTYSCTQYIFSTSCGVNLTDARTNYATVSVAFYCNHSSEVQRYSFSTFSCQA